MKSKKTNDKKNPFLKFMPMFAWVYENGILVSRIEYRSKAYMKRGFLYNHPPAFNHKYIISNN